MPRVTAVVLNWNRRDDTRACVESLLKQTHPVDVLVVDNGSTECAAEDLVRSFAGVRLLGNEENLGFARGMNTGIDAALVAGAELVWVVNNDTLAAPDCLERLVAALDAHPEAAAVSPLIYDLRRPGLLSHGGGRVSLARGRTWHLHEGLAAPPHDAPYACDFVEGCAPLLRAEDLRAQGGFDASYGSYWEDVDWCLTARRRGREVMMVPGARIDHRVSGSTDVHAPYPLYHRARNRFRCARKHGTLRQRLALPFVALAEMPEECYHLRRASGGWAAPRAWVRGTLHGLVGRGRFAR
jgi:GT2 family glycosyltransferase